jgi:hypothetical protein
MAAILAISLLLEVPRILLVIQALVLTACAAFIVSRPTAEDR